MEENDTIQETRHRRYLELLRTMEVRLGDSGNREIELVSEPEQFLAIEQRQIAKHRADGHPECYGYVGVVFENPWYVIIQDAVRFRPKVEGGEPIEGTYIRAIFRGDAKGQKSVLTLLRLPDQRFLLNLCFRHPSRSWKVEAAGTITREGETHDAALKRCVTDESGAEILCIHPLGQMISDRGLFGTPVPIFLVDVAWPSERVSDLTVAGHVQISAEELDQAFLDGVLTRGNRTFICDDSYTAYALYLARLRGLVR